MPPPSDYLLVMSSLATLRWRQGRLVFESAVVPSAVEVHPLVIPMLMAMTQPKRMDELLAIEPGPPKEARLEAIDLLLEARIIDRVPPPLGEPHGPWWDPSDRSRHLVATLKLVQVAHGLGRSLIDHAPVDGHGRDIPWLARPAVDFLDQLDLRGLRVFEYGGGGSTGYWLRRGAAVDCVESSVEWADRLCTRWADHPSFQLALHTDLANFVAAIHSRGGAYDIVLVDAHPDYRQGCGEAAASGLRKGGLLLLDDAPFYPEVAQVLRQAGLLEVDLTGYTPLEDNLQTTAIFLHPRFDLPRLEGPAPRKPFGSPGYRWIDWLAE